MKNIYDIIITSNTKYTNKRNTTNNRNLNNQQHKLNTNNNKKKLTQKRNIDKSILQYFPSTNTKVTIPNESSSKPSLTSNLLDSFLTTKTHQIVQ